MTNATPSYKGHRYPVEIINHKRVAVTHRDTAYEH